MSSSSTPLAVAGKRPRDLDCYFEICLYLLALIAFLGLVASGGLSATPAAVAGIVFAVKAMQLYSGKQVLLPERWATVIAVGYIAFAVADYFVISRNFLPPVVHLVVFATLLRLFTLRRERDYATLAALSFLMVLAAAVITVDSLFLLCFAGFLLMAVITFVLMEMRHAQRSSTLPAVRAGHDERRLPSLLARLGPVLMICILALAAGIFFLLPRKAAGYLGAYNFGTDLSTGFSNKVQLGQIGRIQQSDAVAMHIQVEGDSSGDHNFYWRGISLSQFDGTEWFNPYHPFGQVLGPALGETFDIPNRGSGRMTHIPSRSMVRYRVVLEPIGTSVFFGPNWLQRIRGPYRRLFVSDDGDVTDADIENPVGRYDAESDMQMPAAADLRRVSIPAGDASLQRYLQLPALDARVGQLAASVTASATNPYDKTVQVESYLRTHYGYTLQLPNTPVKDPVTNFLFERKQGHCEYFASSMAVMLRTLGIPTRVVNGFRGGEFNRITGEYIVRARDAHSWVEAYFPGEGWIRFDPTPADGLDGHSLSRIALYLDALSSFWRDWVVSYDKGQQMALEKTALFNVRAQWESMLRWSKHKYHAMVAWADRKQQGWSAPGGSGVSTVLPRINISILLLMVGIGAGLLWRRTMKGAAIDPPQVAARWYVQMTKLMALEGYQKTDTQTAGDFVRAITQRSLREPVSEFIDSYQAARFGASTDAAQKLPALLQNIKDAIRA